VGPFLRNQLLNKGKSSRKKERGGTINEKEAKKALGREGGGNGTKCILFSVCSVGRKDLWHGEKGSKTGGKKGQNTGVREGLILFPIKGTS